MCRGGRFMKTPHVFYFGPWDHEGHYLRDTSLRTLWPDNSRIGPWRLGELDVGLKRTHDRLYKPVKIF